MTDELKKREAFNRGWREGVNWTKKNWFVGNDGHKNVSGSRVKKKMMTFKNEPGYDAGFTEGINYTLHN